MPYLPFLLIVVQKGPQATYFWSSMFYIKRLMSHSLATPALWNAMCIDCAIKEKRSGRLQDQLVGGKILICITFVKNHIWIIMRSAYKGHLLHKPSWNEYQLNSSTTVPLHKASGAECRRAGGWCPMCGSRQFIPFHSNLFFLRKESYFKYFLIIFPQDLALCVDELINM